jgi:all-beta uncharacterized protein
MRLRLTLIFVSAIAAFGCTKNSTPSTPTTCAYTVPGAQAVPVSGATLSLSVTKTSGSCSWTATSDSSWITFSNSTGTDSATLTATIAANAATSARTGTITVTWTGGSAQVAVNQAAAAPPATCTYSLSIATQSVPVEGGALSVNVIPSGTTNCAAWAAANDMSWITITGGGSGTGAGTITYTVAANPDAVARTGSITVTYGSSTTRLTVEQAPVASCVYTLSPTSADIALAGGSGSFTATRNTPNGCSWAAATADSWITLTGNTSGPSPGTISFTAAANTTGAARTGTITVTWSGGAATFTVRQTATPPCTYSLNPSTQTVPAAGGSSFSVVVTPSDSACAWRAEPDQSWIGIVSGDTNTGPGTVVYRVLANTTGMQRQGNLNIIGFATGSSALAITQQP